MYIYTVVCLSSDSIILPEIIYFQESSKAYLGLHNYRLEPYMGTLYMALNILDYTSGIIRNVTIIRLSGYY